jgi:hypothetical protein
MQTVSLLLWSLHELARLTTERESVSKRLKDCLWRRNQRGGEQAKRTGQWISCFQVLPINISGLPKGSDIWEMKAWKSESSWTWLVLQYVSRITSINVYQVSNGLLVRFP